MSVQPLAVSDEEAEALDFLLQSELASSNVELHHTYSVDYRDQIKHHIELVHDLIKKVEAVRGL